MIIKVLAVVSVLAMTISARAAVYGEYCNARGQVTEYICGGYPPGPGWYQGQDGCWYLNTGRPCGYQPVPPGPGPTPVPPPGQVRFVRCESYGFQYNECWLGFNVRRVTLTRQWSNYACVAYQTFGAYNDRMWVRNGCAGDFMIEYY